MIRKKALQYSLVLLAITLVTSCSVTVEDYQGTKPALKLEEFFNGSLTAYGLVQGPGGKVLRRFKVDMVGTWDDTNGILEEDFLYDDGETQQRTWHLQKLANGVYAGTASDVIGKAEGQTAGLALNWVYQLDVQVQGKTWRFTLDDWMYLIDDKRMINRTKLKKFGFKVGELTLWIEKNT